MNAKDVLRSTMALSQTVITKYVDDLTDAEILQRPGPGCNHVAWALGHLIASEVGLLSGICPGKAAELPAGFTEKHDKKNAASDNPADFLSCRGYLDLFAQVRTATLAAMDQMSDAELDEPGPEHFRKMLPTKGHVLMLIGTHPMMHAGQFVPLRRRLGKPVVI
jgi:hypothetical protein